MQNIKQLINKIATLDAKNLFGHDFINTWDKKETDLRQLLLVAETLKAMRDNNISSKMFDSGLAVSLFRDNSTRTRFSYSSAANLLGLAVQDLDEGKAQIAHGETVRETANMISFLSEVIGIRDDMYLGAGEKYMREVGDALTDGFQQGVLPRRPSIVNLQSDVDHPTQSMADLQHLVKYFGNLENLKGKKIAVTWAYSPSYGKPLSVPQGIIGLMTRFGMDVSLAYPKNYNLIPEVEQLAAKQAKENGSKFEIVDSMEAAFENADIIYPKSWAPYWVMGERTKLLNNKNHDGLKALEKQALAENANFMNWETDEAKVKLTKGGKALYMHPLPADISGLSCVNGEVTNKIFDRYRIETYKEAGWKPYVIAAMMLTSKFQNPAQVLQQMLNNASKRVLF
ncbi:MAG: knotted carbamoyltransferase YgeW [Bacteroidales bacterium]|nr:knotted carbamoyltransferase YgeW [Bacteroidales bacterium]